MRRVAAVTLPSFRIALVRARDPSAARELAVIVSSDATERRLTGGKRIDDASDEARARGVLPGATVASAKAKCAELSVRVLHPAEATRALEGLAEALLGFGAITAPLLDRDAVIVDVTGCAHLHGRSADAGEAALLDAIVACVARAGFSCRAAIASGPEIAWAIARASPSPRVVPAEETMRALGELSIDALRLEASTASYFHKLGVRTIAAMRALPRDALTSRMDNENLLPRVRALLDGDDRTPVPRFSPPVTLEERAELEYGVEHTEALLFVLKGLCERLAARLEGRCALAACLEVVLELDRAMCAPGRESVVRVSLPLASPVRTSAELLVVLRSRFERVAPFEAPVRAVALRAPELAPKDERTRHLFVPESRAEIALPKLAAELGALLGEGSLGTLAIADDWRLDRRSVLVPLGAARAAGASFGDVEPLRVIPPRAAGSLEEIAHLARYEHVAWWLGERAASDVVLAWDESAIAFVELDARGRARVRGYLD